ncbi:MAG: non-canonical purine NTP pyrophosphatase [Thaumarchaeota archaeon]|nr:non-canonical purine NTP pyrophosphatase [Nitrososphaerota archaeon]MDE1867416.1 non-canonical purine NTP pyrophosphatase [Nitrososphaerota archaeon]
MLSRVFFASSNKNKFEEARLISSKLGISLEFFKCKLQEIQSNSLEEIAYHKATQAFSLCSKPVIIEDDSLFISSLNGFPGPYSSFVFDTIGNKGILKLLSKQRSAIFRSIIAYCEKKGNVMLFDAKVYGKISEKIRGSKWGFDPIFIPKGQTLTYSLLKNKNLVSHRYLALKKFTNWYLNKKKSNG